MRRTHILTDGTKLVSHGQRRYVTFNITDDSRAIIVKRSDNYITATQNHRAAERKGYCRVVTVDFTDGAVFLDSSDSYRRR